MPGASPQALAVQPALYYLFIPLSTTASRLWSGDSHHLSAILILRVRLSACGIPLRLLIPSTLRALLCFHSDFHTSQRFSPIISSIAGMRLFSALAYGEPHQNRLGVRSPKI